MYNEAYIVNTNGGEILVPLRSTVPYLNIAFLGWKHPSFHELTSKSLVNLSEDLVVLSNNGYIVTSNADLSKLKYEIYGDVDYSGVLDSITTLDTQYNDAYLKLLEHNQEILQMSADVVWLITHIKDNADNSTTIEELIKQNSSDITTTDDKVKHNQELIDALIKEVNYITSLILNNKKNSIRNDSMINDIKQSFIQMINDAHDNMNTLDDLLQIIYNHKDQIIKNDEDILSIREKLIYNKLRIEDLDNLLSATQNDFSNVKNTVLDLTNTIESVEDSITEINDTVNAIENDLIELKENTNDRCAQINNVKWQLDNVQELHDTINYEFQTHKMECDDKCYVANFSCTKATKITREDDSNLEVTFTIDCKEEIEYDVYFKMLIITEDTEFPEDYTSTDYPVTEASPQDFEKIVYTNSDGDKVTLIDANIFAFFNTFTQLGIKVGESKTDVTFTIYDDSLIEEKYEKLVVFIYDLSEGLKLGKNDFVVHSIEDDDMPLFGIFSKDGSLTPQKTEGSLGQDSFLLEVTLDVPTIQEAFVTVSADGTLSTEDIQSVTYTDKYDVITQLKGSAINKLYSGINLHVKPNEKLASLIHIVLYDDELIEETENLILTLSNQSDFTGLQDGHKHPGDPDYSKIELLVNDTDTNELMLVVEKEEIEEGESFKIHVETDKPVSETITLDLKLINTQFDVTDLIYIQQGDHKLTTDEIINFLNSTPLELTIYQDQTKSELIIIKTLDDILAESISETSLVRIENNSGRSEIVQSTNDVLITIKDNEFSTLSITVVTDEGIERDLDIYPDETDNFVSFQVRNDTINTQTIYFKTSISGTVSADDIYKIQIFDGNCNPIILDTDDKIQAFWNSPILQLNPGFTKPPLIIFWADDTNDISEGTEYITLTLTDVTNGIQIQGSGSATAAIKDIRDITYIGLRTIQDTVQERSEDKEIIFRVDLDMNRQPHSNSSLSSTPIQIQFNLGGAASAADFEYVEFEGVYSIDDSPSFFHLTDTDLEEFFNDNGPMMYIPAEVMTHDIIFKIKDDNILEYSEDLILSINRASDNCVVLDDFRSVTGFITDAWEDVDLSVNVLTPTVHEESTDNQIQIEFNITEALPEDFIIYLRSGNQNVCQAEDFSSITYYNGSNNTLDYRDFADDGIPLLFKAGLTTITMTMVVTEDLIIEAEGPDWQYIFSFYVDGHNHPHDKDLLLGSWKIRNIDNSEQVINIIDNDYPIVTFAFEPGAGIGAEEGDLVTLRAGVDQSIPITVSCEIYVINSDLDSDDFEYIRDQNGNEVNINNFLNGTGVLFEVYNTNSLQDCLIFKIFDDDLMENREENIRFGLRNPSNNAVISDILTEKEFEVGVAISDIPPVILSVNGDNEATGEGHWTANFTINAQDYDTPDLEFDVDCSTSISSDVEPTVHIDKTNTDLVVNIDDPCRPPQGDRTLRFTLSNPTFPGELSDTPYHEMTLHDTTEWAECTLSTPSSVHVNGTTSKSFTCTINIPDYDDVKDDPCNLRVGIGSSAAGALVVYTPNYVDINSSSTNFTCQVQDTDRNPNDDRDIEIRLSINSGRLKEGDPYRKTITIIDDTTYDDPNNNFSSRVVTSSYTCSNGTTYDNYELQVKLNDGIYEESTMYWDGHYHWKYDYSNCNGSSGTTDVDDQSTSVSSMVDNWVTILSKSGHCIDDTCNGAFTITGMELDSHRFE